MGLFDRLKSKVAGGAKPVLNRTWTDAGVRFGFERPLAGTSVHDLLSLSTGASAQETFLAAYLGQLVSEGACTLTEAEAVVPWTVVYMLQESPEHAGALLSFDLPPVLDLKPVLDCHGTLPDKNFDVFVSGWALGSKRAELTQVAGAVATVDGAEALLPHAVWRTTEALRQFAARSDDRRSQHENELGWGAIRQDADAAQVFYGRPYLETTFVLTPQTLRLPQHRQETAFGRVLTVEPTFNGAPAGWLGAFDGFNSVQPHYDLAPKGGGHVRVVISEPVRKVLEVIKRDMPGRKVAGARAEQFLHNPWAFLGESAREVLDEDDFALDRSTAGALVTPFSVTPRMDGGRIARVDLVVTEHFFGGAASTQSVPFEGFDGLGAFIASLEAALRDERPRFPWNEFDLTIDGDSSVQLEHAQQILHLWRNQSSVMISFEDVYEMEGYSGRIEGIGVAKPIYVPLIQKPKKEEGETGWIPGESIPLVKVTLAGHDGQVIIPLSKEWLEEFESQVRKAETAGEPDVKNSSLPTSIATAQARTLSDSFRAMLSETEKVKPESGGKERKERVQRETLLVKLNFYGVDYIEERKQSLALPDEARTHLPQCLRPNIKLKKHQLEGVAWFQHLVSKAPTDCRGALFADDMGLGKTLQLLCLLARFYEDSPQARPSIILAPKSLVENWAAEMRKFFNDSLREPLVLFGDALKARKQPLSLIDSQLQVRGVVELLKPTWADNAQIIITSYEVLTSYEFSLARQPFSFVICDEAQRIKTPGTQAAAAARALKTDFRIACTGTPVENSLADLWCLFDFVQPGFLGGLEEFGKTYRRPIECDTDEQKEALVRLQEAIGPQTLRRTKLDIKGELPDKYFASGGVGQPMSFKEELGETDRLEVAMSSHQNILYLGGLKKLQDAAAEVDGRRKAKLSFGALHLMKAVCAEPYCLPGMKFSPDKSGQSTHLLNAPKLAWLIEHLKNVRNAGEKAIVFTELREVQASLFCFIRDVFGIKADTINGDSQGRQATIERFSKTEGFNVIILSTLAAGAGLNVTAANHVIHFTRAWNPAKENQATDRAFRIGQERDVFVYCPVTVSSEYTTFDVRLDELLRRKAGLADATIGGSAMISMLNGAGRNLTMGELVQPDGPGAAAPKRFLTIDDVDRMDGFKFEVLCRLLWSRAGYVASVTAKKGGDAGVDVIAFKGKDGELLQCKSSSGHELGWDALKEVHGGAPIYQARYPGTRFRRLAVTNQRFNGAARAYAETMKVSLVERERLEEMLGRHPIDNHEFDDEVGIDVIHLHAA